MNALPRTYALRLALFCVLGTLAWRAAAQDSVRVSVAPDTGVRVAPDSHGAGSDDLSRYGREWESIKNEWNSEKTRHAQRVAEIQKQFPEGPRRQAALEAENARHLEKSRELGTRRNAIHQKVIEEANRRAASGTTDASKGMRETAGTKPGEKGYRGQAGDLDAGAGARTADKVDDVLKDMGIQVDKKVHAGTVEYGDDFNLTVNKEGQMGRAGSAAHQTQVGMDARNPETYVSEGMTKDQPGRKAVEVQDHIKKGTDALTAPPDRVAADPELQQKMAKSAHKVMNTGTVNDGDLERILKESGLNETPQQFKERMERIKEGRAKPGDITPENAGKLQEATRRIAETATETSGKMAEAEIKSTRERIADLERTGTPEARAEAQKLREQLVDSKTRLEETRRANKEKLGGSGDVDGPGRGPKDADGVGGRVADVDGPGRGPKDVDGAGRGPLDADGVGVKGSPPESPGKLQQVGKVLGDYMEGVMILEQAEMVREGIKTGDKTKIAQGLAGEDLGKRTEMQGARDLADAMGEMETNKKAEVDMAETSKLKRMGATPGEIADYQKAKEAGDLETARKIAHSVRDRGGKDTKPREALEGAPPEDSGWDAKDQLAEGTKQAGSYLEWGANVLTGGFTGKRKEAAEGASEMTDLADNIDEKTKELVRQNLINKLAGTGEISVKEARELVDKLERGDREEFDRVVGELREKGAFEKTRGKYGMTPNEGVDIPETDYKQEAKNTLTGLKEALVDRPAGIISSIAEDSLEATVGSEKYANERNEAERTQELKDQYQRKYEGLLREGATPEQAKQALDGPMGSVNKLLTELRERREKDKLKGATGKEKDNERDQENKGKPEKVAKGGDDKGQKGEKPDKALEKITSDIFDTTEPQTSDKHDFAKTGNREPYKGPVNDGGQRVDAGVYDEGDTVVTADGTEWEKKDGQWVKTGNNYGPYSPEDGLKGAEPPTGDPDDTDDQEPAGGAGLTGFTEGRGERVGHHTKGSYGLMSGHKDIADATTSSEQAEKESRGLLNSAGADAQTTRDKSAVSTAAGDREQSWGKAMGDGIQQGIEKGLTSAAETFGSRAADKASGQIFRTPKTESGSSGGSADSGSSSQPPSVGGSGGGGAKGGGAPPPKGGGQKIVKGPSPPGPPPTSTAQHHCPKCGRTDLVRKDYEYTDPSSGQPVGVTEWRCPVCNVLGKLGPPPPGLSAPGITSTESPPPSAPNPPVIAAPTTPTPPPPKKTKTIVRCPICKSTSVTPYESAYGPAYRCAGCGGAIKAYAMIYETVEE